MVALDGTFYQIKADGVACQVDDDMKAKNADKKRDSHSNALPL